MDLPTKEVFKLKMMTKESWLAKNKHRLHPDLTLYGEYTGVKNGITLICSKGHITTKSSSNALRGLGCNECRKVTNEQAQARLDRVRKGEFKIMSEVTTYRNAVRVTHSVCGGTYITTLQDLVVNNRACEVCKENKRKKHLTALQ